MGRPADRACPDRRAGIRTVVRFPRHHRAKAPADKVDRGAAAGESGPRRGESGARAQQSADRSDGERRTGAGSAAAGRPGSPDARRRATGQRAGGCGFAPASRILRRRTVGRQSAGRFRSSGRHGAPGAGVNLEESPASPGVVARSAFGRCGHYENPAGGAESDLQWRRSSRRWPRGGDGENRSGGYRRR